MRRARGVATGVVLAALVGGLVTTLLISRSSSDRAAERRAVKAYADAIRPLAVDGGRIVQQEIKPRLVDLRQGEVNPEHFREEAARWLTQFRRISNGFLSTPHPPRLDAAAGLYGEAMDGYIAAVKAWISASRIAGKDARNAAIADAADIAERADDTYDRARSSLAREMRRVGLDVPDL